MKTYNLEIGGQVLEVVRDLDGKFIIPERFRGTGTALKPAFEPIVLARKPLSEKTVAANVLRWGTGALNIGATRIGTEGGGTHCNMRDADGKCTGHPDRRGTAFGLTYHGPEGDGSSGRWPANVVHSGEPSVVAAFPNTNPAKAGARGGKNPNPMDWGNGRADGHIVKGHSDNGGSAARFFYSAKASKQDRNGSKHPTVKPIALMQWLARLITPPGGTVLDPFAGSGTTGAACEREGFRCVLVERETEYVADIRARFDPNAAPVTAAPGRRIYGIFADERGVKGGRLDKAPSPLDRLIRWNAAVTSYRAAAHV